MPAYTLTDTATGKRKGCIATSAASAARCCIGEVRYVPLMHSASIIESETGDLVVTDETGAEVGRYTATVALRSAVAAASTPVSAATTKQVAFIQRLVREHGHLGRSFDLAALSKREAHSIIESYADEGCHGFRD